MNADRINFHSVEKKWQKKFLSENKTWENTLIKNLPTSNNGDGFFLSINKKCKV